MERILILRTCSMEVVDDEGNEKYVSVEDDWLTEKRLDIGSEWPKEI
ncbi:hypothetical protein [Oribacterium sp. WCC10]|nr:hypothetical protein [Oribacterium sp. WCC10]SFG69630.1 hypothetical protein SAMN05216356_1205 [Oribacterium sp. WCC10]